MIKGFYTYSPEYIVTHMNEFLVTKDNRAYPIRKDDIYHNIKYDDYETVKVWCKEFDIPFIESIWKEVTSLVYCDYDKNSTFGRYLSHMKLPSYKYFTYEDSQKLNDGIIYGYTD